MDTDAKPNAKRPRVRILVAITGASGMLYAQRLLDNLDPQKHEVHVVTSNYAQSVIAQELPGGLKLAPGVKTPGLKSMNVPFASGSNPFDAMVVIPCTMGTMGRIAHGYSEDVLLRAADVMLKERRKLILVPREAPLSLIHVKNFELLLLAGAVCLLTPAGFAPRFDAIRAAPAGVERASIAAMMMSRPVFMPPSVRSVTRLRRPLRSNTWCASARPSSHGPPAFFTDESGDAPVPPS